MTSSGKQFENQIHRITELLERHNSKVILDHKIPDPDNPEQPRQIDIYVENENGKIHIECRDRKSKQDVMWIEELYGRKKSLNADKLIAVSASGFTKGAIKKAKRLSIYLRTLSEITPNEISSWNEPIKFIYCYYLFRLSTITFITTNPEESIPDNLYYDILEKNGELFNMFNHIATNLNKSKVTRNFNRFTFNYHPRLKHPNPAIASLNMLKWTFEGEVKFLEKEVLSNNHLVYKTLSGENQTIEAAVKSIPDSHNEIIIQDLNCRITCDFSSVTFPKNCMLKHVQCNAGTTIKTNKLFFIGSVDYSNMYFENGHLSFRVGYAK